MLAVLSGGGTAGHINPALALADELVSRGWDVRFAGTPGGVESRLVPAAGIPFTAFEASGFDRIASGLPREGRGEDRRLHGQGEKVVCRHQARRRRGFWRVRVHSRGPSGREDRRARGAARAEFRGGYGKQVSGPAG